MLDDNRSNDNFILSKDSPSNPLQVFADPITKHQALFYHKVIDNNSTKEQPYTLVGNGEILLFKRKEIYNYTIISLRYDISTLENLKSNSDIEIALISNQATNPKFHFSFIIPVNFIQKIKAKDTKAYDPDNPYDKYFKVMYSKITKTIKTIDYTPAQPTLLEKAKDFIFNIGGK